MPMLSMTKKGKHSNRHFQTYKTLQKVYNFDKNDSHFLQKIDTFPHPI